MLTITWNITRYLSVDLWHLYGLSVTDVGDKASGGGTGKSEVESLEITINTPIVRLIISTNAETALSWSREHVHRHSIESAFYLENNDNSQRVYSDFRREGRDIKNGTREVSETTRSSLRDWRLRSVYRMVVAVSDYFWCVMKPLITSTFRPIPINGVHCVYVWLPRLHGLWVTLRRMNVN